MLASQSVLALVLVTIGCGARSTRVAEDDGVDDPPAGDSDSDVDTDSDADSDSGSDSDIDADTDTGSEEPICDPGDPECEDGSCIGVGCVPFEVDPERPSCVRLDASGALVLGEQCRRGFWGHVFQGCDGGTRWESLHYEAQTEPGTAISLSTRTADSVADLEGKAWTLVAEVSIEPSPADLSTLPQEDYLEVMVSLGDGGAEDAGLPRLLSLEVTFFCEGES